MSYFKFERAGQKTGTRPKQKWGRTQFHKSSELFNLII